MRRPARIALLDAGFAIAARLNRFGLAPYTARIRRAVARLGGDEYAVEVDGFTIGGSLAGHGTYLSLLAAGNMHPFQAREFAAAVRPGDVVLDCGAHIGWHTLIAARAVGPKGRVIAIEPLPENADALRANVERNGFADRVHVVRAVASNRSGEARLHVHRSLDQAAVTPIEGSDPLREVVVPAVRLDEVVAERPVDVLKVDVEGDEAVVLDGLEATLAITDGLIAFIECHPSRLEGAGVDPGMWVAGLRKRGKLEIVDDLHERLLPADDPALTQALDHHRDAAFNVRWELQGGTSPDSGCAPSRVH